MKIIGVIPARYESSRFPGKPLANINGKPMIWWVYNQALKVGIIDNVIVATDDERIFEICRNNNINVTMTSSDIKTGADRVAEVAEKIDGDIFLNIQGDEPLIEPDAILQIINEMEKDDSIYYLGLKSKLESEDEWKAPNVVKTVTDSDGYALYFSRSAIPYDNYKDAYRVMGLYGYRRDFLIQFKKWGQSSLEIAERGVEMLRAMQHGYKIKLVDSKYHSVGVDMPEHIEIIEKIMSRQFEEGKND